METNQTKTPKKIGRPPINQVAMTNRERQKKWRDKTRAEALRHLAELKLD